MTKLRKLQKAIVKEGQRRSPRICALEAWQANGSESKNGTKCSTRRNLDNAQGPAFRTRGRKKRKLRPVQEVTASASASVLSPPNQDVSHSHDEGIQNKSDQPSKVPSSTVLPEKRILELVLDTLQRRDTYEIFAEPVDPNEVEDYYEIVEEPMDFGTMRAKLHEGMYKSLEHFEHDVFLIFNNAMHFNSSGTIYFRQARGINELAKKVFDLLKTNPEKFELEFSETRRRVTRRNAGDFRDSTDMKSSEITSGLPSKTVPCSSRGTPNRKSFKANHGCSDIAKHVDARDVEVPTGTKENSRYRSFEVDRRSTYTPLSLGEDKPIFSSVYGILKQLEYVNQQEVGYRDSLMMFVKDLGPTAQNMAKRKLLGCEIHTASTSVPCRPNTLSPATALMSQYPLNQFPDHSNETESPREEIDLSGGKTSFFISDKTDNVKVGGTLNADREKVCSPLEGNTQGSHRWSFGCDKVFSNQSFCSDSYYSRACADDMNFSDYGSKETGKKSMMTLFEKSKLVNQEQLSVSNLENFQADVLESRFENKCKFQSRPWPLESSDVSCFVQDKSQMPKSSSECFMGVRENVEAKCPTNEIGCSSEGMKNLKSDQTASPASSFMFNLPYLKTRLDQINSSEQYRFLQLDSSGKMPFSAQVNYHGVLTRNPPTDLCASLYSHYPQP